jgi:hypothetical protein
VFCPLYGLDRGEAEYVLPTFPIVKREDGQRHDGRSRVLILGYMAALAAGCSRREHRWVTEGTPLMWSEVRLAHEKAKTHGPKPAQPMMA